MTTPLAKCKECNYAGEVWSEVYPTDAENKEWLCGDCANDK